MEAARGELVDTVDSPESRIIETITRTCEEHGITEVIQVAYIGHEAINAYGAFRAELERAEREEGG